MKKFERIWITSRKVRSCLSTLQKIWKKFEEVWKIWKNLKKDSKKFEAFWKTLKKVRRSLRKSKKVRRCYRSNKFAAFCKNWKNIEISEKTAEKIWKKFEDSWKKSGSKKSWRNRGTAATFYQFYPRLQVWDNGHDISLTAVPWIRDSDAQTRRSGPIGRVNTGYSA